MDNTTLNFKALIQGFTIIDSIKRDYNKLWKELSLSQSYKLLGGNMSYESKAKQAKLVSKSKVVHKLADRIIERCKQLDNMKVGIK